jgi:hypothetical protein
MAKRLDVYDLYLLSLDFINQNERGQFELDKWNRAANLAIRDFVNYLTGRLDEPPEQSLALIKNQKIADLLFPIFKKQMMPFKDGIIPIPADYEWYLDLRISGDPSWKPGNCDGYPAFTIDQIMNGQNGFRQIDVLSHDEISGRVNTHIPLLKKRPCAEMYNEGFSIYNAPEKNGSVFLAYVIEPEETFLSMTQDPDTNMPVYDKPGSKQPPLDKKAGPYIARKIAQYYFQGTRDSGGIEISDAVSKTK